MELKDVVKLPPIGIVSEMSVFLPSIVGTNKGNVTCHSFLVHAWPATYAAGEICTKLNPKPPLVVADDVKGTLSR